MIFFNMLGQRIGGYGFPSFASNFAYNRGFSRFGHTPGYDYNSASHGYFGSFNNRFGRSPSPFPSLQSSQNFSFDSFSSSYKPAQQFGNGMGNYSATSSASNLSNEIVGWDKINHRTNSQTSARNAVNNKPYGPERPPSSANAASSESGYLSEGPTETQYQQSESGYLSEGPKETQYQQSESGYLSEGPKETQYQQSESGYLPEGPKETQYQHHSIDTPENVNPHGIPDHLVKNTQALSPDISGTVYPTVSGGMAETFAPTSTRSSGLVQANQQGNEDAGSIPQTVYDASSGFTRESGTQFNQQNSSGTFREGAGSGYSGNQSSNSNDAADTPFMPPANSQFSSAANSASDDPPYLHPVETGFDVLSNEDATRHGVSNEPGKASPGGP